VLGRVELVVAPDVAQRLDSCQLLNRAAAALALDIREHEVRVLGQNLNAHGPSTVWPQCLDVTHRVCPRTYRA
jgi:hypothetical protein